MPNESQATSLLSAAISLHKAGDHAAAQEQYRRVLAQTPDHAEALYLSGALDYQLGDFGEAATKLERSLAARPGHLPALGMQGAVAAKLGDFPLAARCFETAAAHKPAAPEMHYNHGFALFYMGEHAKAASAFRKALALKADHAQAQYLLAVALRLEGQLAEAATVYAQVIASQPGNIAALDEYGGVLFDLGKFGEAETLLHRVIAAAPDAANPYTNLGRMFQADPARAAEALGLHDQAIARDPKHAEAHNNRGVVLYGLGRFDEAAASFRQAIVLKPTSAEAHHNLAQALLTVGDMAAGWIAYEWRSKCRDWKTPPRNFKQATWTGEDVGGKRLLVWGEQGVGDELLQGTMVADLAERGLSITWETEPRLVPLIKRSYPSVQVIGRATPPDALTKDSSIAAQISAASLGRYLRPTTAAFPERRGHLKADPARTAAYRQQLLGPGKTRVIGVSWISTHAEAGKYKSSALDALTPIWRGAGSTAQFVDLQYGETAQERKTSHLDLMHIDDLDLFHDLDGLAALIAACDVVVTVSNTTAHLAGALGIPVCVMVPGGSAKLWFWGAGEGRSLWYPSARIFKQRRPHAWDDVIARVVDHIADQQ